MAVLDPEYPQDEAKLVAALQKWADGKATLRDVRGYTDEELQWLAGEARKHSGHGREVYVLFNNLAMAKDARRF